MRGAAAIYSGTAFSQPLRISLEAVVPFDSARSGLPYRTCDTPEPTNTSCIGCYLTTPPPADCSGALSNRREEIDVSRLLNSFDLLVSTRRSAMVPFDFALLFTHRDLASSVIDFAFQGSVCTSASSGVVQVFNDTAINSTLVAHALGHGLNMPHDGLGAPFVMAPAITSPPSTTFSSASITAASNYLLQPFAQCVNDGGTWAWSTTRCHDGRVDPGEQCDPGLLVDACCTSTCQLAAGCTCASSDGCCRNGAVADAGVPCRAGVGICDTADTCDGRSSRCPDPLALPGTPCNDGGTCLRDACIPSRDQLCASLAGGGFATGACNPVTTCGTNGLFCVLASGGSCQAIASQIVDGLPCGAGNLCLGTSCLPSAALITWRWSVSAFSACVNGLHSRTVVCENEAGASGIDALCPQPKPITVENCP